MADAFQRPGDEPEPAKEHIEIIDVADYQPHRIPSKTWRECIRKIWEVDPLLCPRCSGPMKIVAFITDPSIIYKILEHLGLWNLNSSRSPPPVSENEPVVEIVYEPIVDDWPTYEEPGFQIN